MTHPYIKKVSFTPDEPAPAPARKQEVVLEDGTVMIPLRLRPVRHDPEVKKPNKYCGPAVLSSITGMTTDEAAALFTHVSGRKRITGTSYMEMEKALKLCGASMEKVDLKQARRWVRENWPNQKNLTLASWLMYTQTHRPQGDIYLISAGNHWQLVEANQFVCGQVMNLVPLRAKGVHRASWVKHVWIIRSDLLTNQVVIPKEARPV